MGADALPLTRAFGRADLRALAGNDAVYFNVPLFGLVHYPAGWALPLALLALFGVIVLAVVGRRTELHGHHGGFWGLLAGTASSVGMWAWVRVDPRALRIIAGSADAKALAEDMYRALWSWLICVGVTVVVSYLTQPKPEAELVGLVRGCTDIPSEGDLPLVKRPIFWAGVVFTAFIVLQIVFW